MDQLHWLWTNLPFKEFLNPDKRIYWPYLALCLVYALIFMLFSRHRVKNTYVKSWFSASARIDYAIWIFNYFLQVSVLPLVFSNALFLAGKFYHFLTLTFGTCTHPVFSNTAGLVWYSIIFFLVTDFSRFGLHYLLHHNRFLAPLHRMHHSAEVLTPITLYRSHPFEMVLSHLRFLLVYSTITGAFLYMYNDYFEFPQLFGAGFFVIISNVLGANLRHSNIPIGFGWFERLFISPKQHQMHHSNELPLQNSNLGSMLSVWDMLFSTWMPSKNIGKISYGLAEQHEQSFWQELVYPFTKWFGFIKKTSPGQ